MLTCSGCYSTMCCSIKVYNFIFSCMQIIVLEDTKEYISYAPKEEIKAQDRRPFDLLVCSYAEKRIIVTVNIWVLS